MADKIITGIKTNNLMPKVEMKQIRTLEKLRDTLLPKLMRGEIKVQL